ncbi:MAG: hypothetical protein ACI97A_002403 [Planctomycetota bacterium]|jgi:hypothetical protein
MKRSSLLLSATLAVFLFASQAAIAQNPQADFDKKSEACDFTDPESIYELATWAMSSKNSKVRKEGRKLMKEVIDLDEDHEGARGKLGFVKVGEKWFTKKKAAKARKAIVQDAMKENGFIWFKNGWIKKTLKRKWNNKWEKNAEDTWQSYEAVMSAKGYTLYKGQWLPMVPEDLKRMELHRKNTGEDILIVTTKHFVIHTSIPVKFVQQYSELAEKVYDWYMQTYGITGDRAAMFLGRRAHIWTFETTGQFQDWVTTYSEFYKFTGEDKTHFRERPSGRLLGNKRILSIVSEEPENIENSLLHQLGVLLQWYNIQAPTPEWMSEGFGHLVEELFSGVKFGRVNMSTRARYANGGGIADKEYNTKDGRPQTKGLVKAGEDVPIDELSKKTLNTLDKDNLAQGFSITEWLYNHNREKYLNMIKTMKGGRALDGPANVRSGITKGVGMSVGDFEREWRKYVKSKYK